MPSRRAPGGLGDATDGAGVSLRLTHEPGFCLDGSRFHVGGATSYVALQFGLWAGYERIHVYGIDLGAEDGVFYADGSAPKGDRQKRFAAEVASFTWAAQNLPVEVRSRVEFHSDLNREEWVKAWT